MNNEQQDLEPSNAAVLELKMKNRRKGPYIPKSLEEVKRGLDRFFTAKGLEDSVVSRVSRLMGGISEEMFTFDLSVKTTQPTTCVLRLDPLESIVATSRMREFQMLKAVDGRVPAPYALWVDPNGTFIDRPALITSFVDGVSKPTNVRKTNTSGIGTVIDSPLRESLIGPFVEHLQKIHLVDWRGAGLDDFQVPDADPYQAARWQVNWWARVWEEDALQCIPLMTLVETWLKENIPETQELVLVHSDYRTGNFLFDERTQKITAILDWEMGHIGDFHEDLAYVLMDVWSYREKGETLVCSLTKREAFLDAYSSMTGRSINPKTLHFYEVFCAWKCAIIAGTSARVAHQAHSHNGVVLAWTAGVAHRLLSDLCHLLEKEL